MPQPPLLRRVSTSVIIAGQVFPVSSWKAVLANHGSMGTATAKGSLSDLINSGLDIVDASQAVNGATFDIRIGYDGGNDLVFSGVVDDCDLNWDDDSFEVRGRDHSAVLADGRQTVAGLDYRNQTIGQIARQIAAKFGFKADITDPGIMAGPEMNGENFYVPQPRNYWNMLQELADTVGYECYVTPEQVLYFGPEREQGSVEVNYGAQRGVKATNPAWGFRVHYSPRNNSNIVVKALSVNLQTRQTVTASATAAPTRLGKGRKSTSTVSGNPSKAKYPSPGGSGSTSKAKTIYYIREPGLSPEQAQAKCQAMADSLAKHQIVCEMSIDGLTSLKLHSRVTVVESTISLYGFAGVPMNVAEVTHSFNMPSDQNSQEDGFVTSFRAIALVEDA